MKLSVALVFLLVSSLAVAEPVTIAAEQWARPRSAAFVAHELGLAPLAAAFERQPDGAFILRHGRSEEATLWAEELRAWLVALGVPSAHIVLHPASELSGRLTVDVRGYRER